MRCLVEKVGLDDVRVFFIEGLMGGNRKDIAFVINALAMNGNFYNSRVVKDQGCLNKYLL